MKFIDLSRYSLFIILQFVLACTKNNDTPENEISNSTLPEVVSISPASANPGETVRVELKNFKLTYSSDTTGGRSDKILIGTLKAEVQTASANSVTIFIANQHKTNKVTVVIGKDSAVSKDLLTVNQRPGSWQKVTNCPGGIRYNFAGFQFGDSAYFGFGNGPVGPVNTFFLDFWKLNLKDATWEKLFDKAVPNSAYSETVAWQVNNKGYVSFTALAGTETWNYTPSIRLWSKNPSSYPGALFQQSTCTQNDKVYVGAVINPFNSNKSGWYEFNATGNSFTYYADITDTAKSPLVHSFMLGDKIYFGIKQEISGSYYYQTKRFYEFNTSSKTSIRKNDFPENFATWNSSFGFTYKGSGYIINSQKLYKYDSATDTWDQKKDFDGYAGDALNYYRSFEYNGSAYLFVYNGATLKVELWKYTE